MRFKAKSAEHRASTFSLEDLARARGLPGELLRRLGWQERLDGVAVPWPRTEGSVALHVRHHLDGDPDGEPRWTWEAYDRDTLLPYGADRLQDWLDRGHRTVVVAESEVDAVACWKSGVPAVATGGASGWQPRWWSVLRGFDRIVIWLEDAGSCQLLRALVATRPADGPELAVAHNLPGPKDPGRILAEDRVRGPGRVLRAVQAARPVQAVADLLQAVVSHLQARPSGRGYSARCPFHEDRVPSMSLFPGEDGWRWRCHAASCGLSGRLELLGAVLGLVAAGWFRPNLYLGPVGTERGREVAARDLQAQALRSGAPALTFLPFLGRAGFVVRGFSHLIASAPKAGKTSLLAQVVQEWSGETVLWLTEEPEEVWRARLALLPAGALDHLTLYFALGVPREELLDRVRKGTESVVVVDTTKVLGIADDCDAAEVTRALTPFIAACRDRGATLVVSHHERKGGGQYGEGIAGSHAFLALVDIALEILRDSQAPNRRLVRGYGRVLAVPELVYERREGGELVALGDPAELTLREVQERVAALLTGEWQTTKEVLQALGEPKPSDEQIRKALNALVESGRAERDPPPGVKGNRAHRWRRGSGSVPTYRSCPLERNGNGVAPPSPEDSDQGPGGRAGSVPTGSPRLERNETPGSVPTGRSYRLERNGGEGDGPSHEGFPGSVPTERSYRLERNGEPGGACPEPDPQDATVDLLEADLLATLEEDLPEEEPEPPPDPDLLPPSPDGTLGPLRRTRARAGQVGPPGGRGQKPPPRRTCCGYETSPA